MCKLLNTFTNEHVVLHEFTFQELINHGELDFVQFTMWTTMRYVFQAIVFGTNR